MPYILVFVANIGFGSLTLDGCVALEEFAMPQFLVSVTNIRAASGFSAGAPASFPILLFCQLECKWLLIGVKIVDSCDSGCAV